MIFSFDRFSKVAATVYNDETPYSLADCLEVFRCYFQSYEDYKGHPHPPIKAAQIKRIIHAMPRIFGEAAGATQVDRGTFIETYMAMIEQHFKTKYLRCDYNINHFFSGRIRELRFYETCC